MFLRGLPHLAKTMKRLCTKGQKKGPVDSKHEPDLYKISELHPLPEKADENSIMLQCIVQDGPKATTHVGSRPSLHHKDMSSIVTVQTSQLSGDRLVIQSAPEPFTEVRPGPVPNEPATAEGSFATDAPPLPLAQDPTVLKTELPMAILPTPMNSMLMLNHPMHQLLGMVQQSANPNFVTTSSSLFAAGFATAMAQNQQYFNSIFQSNMQALNNAASKP